MFLSAVSADVHIKQIAADRIRELVGKYLVMPAGVLVNFEKDLLVNTLVAKVIAGPSNSMTVTAKSSDAFRAIDVILEKLELKLRAKQQHNAVAFSVPSLHTVKVVSKENKDSITTLEAKMIESNDFDWDNWADDQNREWCKDDDTQTQEKKTRLRAIGGISWSTYL